MRRDALVLAGGLVVLVAAAIPVDAQRVSDLERTVFRAINGGPRLPSGAVWPVMQLGMIGVVPASALVAFALHRHRLAIALLLAGVVAYAGGKAVKRIVERGRPDQLLDDVVIQGQAAHGLGFVSGHAAVAFALATVLWPELVSRRALRGLVVASALLVALARVHVGAHLPLDVLGGAGLGVAAGALALIAVRRPSCS